MILESFAQITRCACVLSSVDTEEDIGPRGFRHVVNDVLKELHKNGGGRRIRTFEGVSQQIYSLPRLTASVSRLSEDLNVST